MNFDHLESKIISSKTGPAEPVAFLRLGARKMLRKMSKYRGAWVAHSVERLTEHSTQVMISWFVGSSLRQPLC